MPEHLDSSKLHFKNQSNPFYQNGYSANRDLIQKIGDYWNEHIHDLAIAKSPVGTKDFFQELDDYRFEKLHYLPQVVNFRGYANQAVLEIGCGVGLDLLRFAQGGAKVTGIDLAESSVKLAKQNFAHHGVDGNLQIMNGEALQFEDDRFDVVYGHGVLQYTKDAHKMVREMHRVLRPGGEAIMMVYNRISWLNALSQIMKVELEHEDAPVLEKYSIREFKQMLSPFARVEIIPERFPVISRLHKGWKGVLYNDIFVPAFNFLPSFGLLSR